MFTSQLLLLALRVSIGTGLAIDILPNIPGASQVVPDIPSILDTNSSSLQQFNATLGDPPDPLDVPWAQNRYLTTFHSYAEPSLPHGSLRAFVDQAISSLGDLRRANHAELDDPIPGGVFSYHSQIFSTSTIPLTIKFLFAQDPPEAAALTYYEIGGVIASLAPYMRNWGSRSPASAALELWKRESVVSEQIAAGYIWGFLQTADQ